eukprot:431118-Pleurochrysis_carterae.AAC.1
MIEQTRRGYIAAEASVARCESPKIGALFSTNQGRDRQPRRTRAPISVPISAGARPNLSGR